MARIANVLDTLGSAARPMGLSDLARALSLPKTSMWRLLHVLTSEQFVQRRTEGYCLGARVLQFADIPEEEKSLRAVAIPYLGDLHAATGAAITLGALHGSNLRILHQVYGHSLSASASIRNDTVPGRGTRLGRFLLGYHDPDFARRDGGVIVPRAGHAKPVGSDGVVAWIACAIAGSGARPVGAVAVGQRITDYDEAKLCARLQHTAFAISASLAHDRQRDRAIDRVR